MPSAYVTTVAGDLAAPAMLQTTLICPSTMGWESNGWSLAFGHSILQPRWVSDWVMEMPEKTST